MVSGNGGKYSERKREYFFGAEVEWNKQCLEKGDPKKSWEKLMKTKWNPDKPVDGAWRQDLRHKIFKN